MATNQIHTFDSVYQAVQKLEEALTNDPIPHEGLDGVEAQAYYRVGCKLMGRQLIIQNQDDDCEYPTVLETDRLYASVTEYVENTPESAH